MKQFNPYKPLQLLQWMLDLFFGVALSTPMAFVACNSSNITLQHAITFASYRDICTCSRDWFGWRILAAMFKVSAVVSLVLLAVWMLWAVAITVMPDRAAVCATVASMRLTILWLNLQISYVKLLDSYKQWRLRRLQRQLQQLRSALQARKQGLYKSPAARFCERVLASRVVRVGISPVQFVFFHMSKILCFVGMMVWLSVQWCSRLCFKLCAWYNHLQRSRRRRGSSSINSSDSNSSSTTTTRKGGKRISQHGLKSAAAASKAAAGSTKAALAAEAAVPSTSITASCATLFTGASTAVGAVASCNKSKGKPLRSWRLDRTTV
jgi:hypothetical protein